MTSNDNTAAQPEELTNAFSEAVDSAIAEVFSAKEAEINAAKVEQEQEEISPLVQENKDLKDQLLRAVAEMENIRKRSERDVQDTRKYAVTGFARDLVNVLENLQLALLNIPEEDRKNDAKLNTLAEGVEMTANELMRVFEGQGIVRISPQGEKFDHNYHQAIAQIEDASKEPGTIVQVLQAGYVIHDRLLRPAMVTVAKAAGGVKVDTQA
jgi:molecular chaperone GrpE